MVIRRAGAFCLTLQFLTAATAPAAGEDRDAVLRALLERSRVLDDVNFAVPLGVWRSYLSESADDTLSAPPAPVALIPQRGLYHFRVPAKGRVSLTATHRVLVFHPKQCVETPVFPSSLAWEEITVNGKEASLSARGGWLRFSPAEAGEYELSGRVVLRDIDRNGDDFNMPIPKTARTLVRLDSPAAWEVVVGSGGRAVRGSDPVGTHGELALTPRTVLKLKYRPPTVAAERPPRYQVRGEIAWNLGAGGQQVIARLKVAIAGGRSDRLDLTVPDGADKLRVSGPDVREVQRGPGAVSVFLRGRLKGTTRLRVQYDLPSRKQDTLQFGCPAVRNGHWTRGTLVVTNTAGSMEIIPGAMDGLRPLALADIPRSASAILAGPAVLAYEVSSRNWSAQVEVLNLGEFALRETIADLAHYVLTYRRDGSVMCRAKYEIRNRTRQFLRVEVPRGATIVLARVSEKSRPATPVPGSKTGYLLPLVRSSASVKGLVSFPVEIVLLYRGRPSKAKGELALPLPKIDLPVAYAWAEVYVPTELGVSRWAGPFRQVAQYSSETAAADLAYGRGIAAEGYEPDKARPEPKGPTPVASVSDTSKRKAKLDPSPPAPKKDIPPTTAQGRSQDVVSALRDEAEPSRSDGTVQSRRGAPTPRRKGAIDAVLAKRAPTATRGRPFVATSPPATADEAPPQAGKPEPEAEPEEPELVRKSRAPRRPLLGNLPLLGGLSRKTVYRTAPMERASKEEEAPAEETKAKIVYQSKIRGDLAKNYYRSGKELYEKGRLEEAAEALSNVLKMSPKSVEADNARRLVSNVRVLQGKEELRSKGEKAAGAQVRGEIQIANTAMEQRQQTLLERGQQLTLAGDLTNAAVQFEAAKALNETLILQGADVREQEARMRKAREYLSHAQVETRTKAAQLRGKMVALKKAGRYEEAIRAGNRLVRMSGFEAAGKAGLQRELNKLVVLDEKRKARPGPLQVQTGQSMQVEELPRAWKVLQPEGEDKPKVGARWVARRPRGYEQSEIRGERRPADAGEVTFGIRAEVGKPSAESIEVTADPRLSSRGLTITATTGALSLRPPSPLPPETLAITVTATPPPTPPAPSIDPAPRPAGQVVEHMRKFEEPRPPRLLTNSYDVRGLLRGGSYDAGSLQKLVGGLTLDGGGGGDGEAAAGAKIQVSNGRMVVTHTEDGLKRIRRLLSRLEEAQAPQVQFGKKIATQRARGLVRIDQPGEQQTEQGDGLAQQDEVAHFIRKNYDWQLADGNQTIVSATSGDTVQVMLGEDRLLTGLQDVSLDQSISLNGVQLGDLATKLSANLGQKAQVSSLNLDVTAPDANALGASFTSGNNGVRYALVDEAQFRTLMQQDDRNALDGRKAAPNTRFQETIVGTDALLANGWVANLSYAGDRANRVDLNGNDIQLTHGKYVLIDNGGFLTAVRTGEMQHWTEQTAAVVFAEVPQDLDVPRAGRLVKFEKTLVKPNEDLVISATYSSKGGRR